MKILKNIFKNRERKRIYELRRAARLIGEYYLEKNKASGNREKIYSSAREDIKNLCITKLEIKNKILFITLSCPGLLIGRVGSNIESLQNFIVAYSDNIIKIGIIEDMIMDNLLPYDYSNDIDWIW